MTALAGDRFLQQLVDSSFDGLFAIDRGLRLLVFNPAMEQLWACARNDVLGRPVLDAFPFLREIGEDQFFTAALRGESVVTRDRPYRYDEHGSAYFFGARYSPIYDDTGAITGALAVVRDTTDHTYNASRIDRDRERLRALMDSANDFIVFKDTAHRITAINHAYCEFLGLADPAEAIGKSDGDLLPVEIARSFRHDAERVLRHGETVADRLEQVPRHDGADRWLRIDRAPILDDGKVIGLVATARDVTTIHVAEAALRARTAELEIEKERAERAVDAAHEASRLKSEFLSTMSHELRTPMNAIIGYSHLLLDGLDGELTAQQAADIGQIARSADQLLALIDDVLDLSKIEAGRMDLATESVDIGGIVRQVADSLAPQAAAKGIALEIDIAVRLGEIDADPKRVRQILLNLLSNAVKFTEQGQVTIAARALPGSVEVRISDTGIGIDRDALDCIFDEFRQADGSTTRRFGGTGLGLAIARNLARLHGGDIDVVSTVGIGSTFTLRLPARRRNDTAALSYDNQSADQIELTPAEGATSVLLVEDDAGFVNLVRRTLERAGVTVVHTPRGNDAIRIATLLRPRLVLLDIRLEDQVDGWHVLHRLRAQPATRGIPVVVISSQDERGMAATLGATDYLIKPIDRAELLAVIDRFGARDTRDVLVVDDDPAILDLMSRLIGADGYRIRVARDGRDALDQIGQMPPGVIVLDLMMPNVDGFAVLEAVRTNEETRHLPIIVVTALDLTPEQFSWLRERTSVILQKSALRSDLLLTEIGRLLHLAPPLPAAS